MGFTTPSYSLKDLFARAERGELQLPDFQREYIWDVDRIRTLVTSVLRGYPIGSFLALDTRNAPMRFRPRPLDGLTTGDREPGLLLLDGQQRLTSLFYALKGAGEIPTVDYLGRRIRRRFFVDVRAAVKTFQNEVLRWLPAYDVPVIRIDRETSQIGVGQIFAHANSAGVQMDVFELLTAVFATEDPNFRLADHFAHIERTLRLYPALDGIGRIEFLRGLSLLITSRKGNAVGHRGDILNISLHDYLTHCDELADAFVAAAEFLAERCILAIDQVPYSSQIIPLAVILARLAEQPGLLDEKEPRDRLNRWYWSGVFGELYGAHAPTIRAGLDVTEVTPWVRGDSDEVPRTVGDAQFHESRLQSATAESGVYRGLYSLLMARGALDWRTGKPLNRDTIAELQPRFHTVFPREFCLQAGATEEQADSVLNRTPMGRRTDVVMENNEPKRYLPRLQSKSLMDDAEFDAMLEGHEIRPADLLNSDWNSFIHDRRDRFVGIIEYALDKPVVRDLDGALGALGTRTNHADGENGSEAES